MLGMRRLSSLEVRQAEVARLQGLDLLRDQLVVLKVRNHRIILINKYKVTMFYRRTKTEKDYLFSVLFHAVSDRILGPDIRLNRTLNKSYR